MSETSPAPPPEQATASSDVGKGYKYEYVRRILGRQPDEWIREQRAVDTSGKRPPYSEIAELLNGLIRKRDRTSSVRVTLESIRRWDPDGEFVRQANLAEQDRTR